MATQNLSNFDPLLKNVYRGAIVEQLNNQTYALDRFRKTNANDLGAFNGRQLIFALHTARNRGRGAVTDGGTLATSGRQGGLDGIVSMHEYNIGIEVTDLAVKQSKNNEGAFISALSWEMNSATTDLKKDLNRMVYGTGDGLLATVLAATTSTIISVDSGQYIAPGDTVDVLTKTNGTSKTSAVLVNSVSFTGTADSSTQANALITLAASAVVTTADGFYISGNRSNESDGLRNITATGRTLHSVASTTNPIWDGNVKDMANAKPSEDAFMQLGQRIHIRSGQTIDGFLSSPGVQRRLANQYQSQKRYNDAQATKIEGGYSAINVATANGATPVIADDDAPNGFAFAVNDSSFAWCQLSEPDWLSPPEGGGGILYLKDGATAGSKVTVWQAWMVWPAVLVNVAANRNGQIKNINDDQPVTRDQ